MEPYTDNQITVSYNHEIHGVSIQCSGFASSIHYRMALRKALKLIEEKGLSKIIADTRSMKMIGAEDQQWTIRYFLPKAVKAGCKAVAIIPSNDYFNRMSLENILECVKRTIFPLRYLTNMESAEKWLKTV